MVNVMEDEVKRLESLALEELLAEITPDKTLRQLKAIGEVAERHLLGSEASNRIRAVLLGQGLIERTAHGLTDTSAALPMDRDLRLNGHVN